LKDDSYNILKNLANYATPIELIIIYGFFLCFTHYIILLFKFLLKPRNILKVS